jgi:GNAT superfamily N-acetyltransferase
MSLAENPLGMLGYKDATWVLAELAGVVEPRPFPHRPAALRAEAPRPMHRADLRVRPELSDEALNQLFSAAWPDHTPRGFANVLSRSPGLGGRLRRRGIGTALVRRAVEAARQGDAEWMHVDYEPRWEDFYEGCGFRPAAAGLIHLGGSG